MEIILGKNLDYKIVGDSIEDLRFIEENKGTDIYVDNMMVADNDGKILLEEGFLSYKKGQVIISAQVWNKKEDKWFRRPIVFDNADVAEIINNLKKEVEVVEDEAV